jgi:hypothetical protein
MTIAMIEMSSPALFFKERRLGQPSILTLTAGKPSFLGALPLTDSFRVRNYRDD